MEILSACDEYLNAIGAETTTAALEPEAAGLWERGWTCNGTGTSARHRPGPGTRQWRVPAACAATGTARALYLPRACCPACSTTSRLTVARSRWSVARDRSA